jgi:hypothetical protein
MSRVVRITLTIVYALGCGAAILLLSGQDYEWMIGERDQDGSVLTHCAIPTPTDDMSDMAYPALILIAVLFAPGLFHLIKQRRIGLSLTLSLGLLALWIYRFLVRVAFC